MIPIRSRLVFPPTFDQVLRNSPRQPSGSVRHASSISWATATRTTFGSRMSKAPATR